MYNYNDSTYKIAGVRNPDLQIPIFLFFFQAWINSKRGVNVITFKASVKGGCKIPRREFLKAIQSCQLIRTLFVTTSDYMLNSPTTSFSNSSDNALDIRHVIEENQFHVPIVNCLSMTSIAELAFEKDY